MAPVSPIPKKRPSRTPSRKVNGDTSVKQTSNKKLRYIPGGPGGGGRYIDDDGNITLVGGGGPGGYNYTGPRGRVGRMNLEKGVVPQSPKATPNPPTTYSRPRRERAPPPPRPRYSSAAVAAAAASDVYKPREERGWEEFHPDLDLDLPLMTFSADEVDGYTPANTKPSTPLNSNFLYQNNHLATESGAASAIDQALLAQQITSNGNQDESITLRDEDTINVQPIPKFVTPIKRRPGRPPRNPSHMLNGLGSPPAPRIQPIPAHNPKEKLTLPKPYWKEVHPFEAYEKDESVQVNYVDRTLANVGYQESDLFVPKGRSLVRNSEGSLEEDLDLLAGASDKETATGGNSVPAPIGRVEYDMDEQDDRWLEAYNAHRKEEQVEAIKPAFFEITMTVIEKEWHALEKRIPKPNPKPPQTHRPRSSSAAAVNGEPAGAGEEQDSKCAICDDGDCDNSNAIVFCDGCDLAVHQECYGVPYVPEGQWMCRKCQLIGRGTPTCIFCPNVDGAFKQTNTLKWAHLLCSIWIPEVSLGNTAFMEPVMDVEKVPKSRWKLNCYICNQKMGACIQCGNKNCFQAFHVTCARRARLFLKMKSSHGGPGTMDASVLKALCDKHVPPDWRRENDVETATAEAKSYYRHTMRGRRWADSQQTALTMGSATIGASLEGGDEYGAHEDAAAVSGSNKRKRGQSQRAVWRLPSGAPVVPHAVYHNVETSLARFSIRKRKDFIAEACKYWTLKREARRGAALLKRLQLQMDTFTSMEITRRDFAAMGAAGGPKLQRRIEFAEMLEGQMEKVRSLCEKLKEREKLKLNDVGILSSIVEVVYFPIPKLLRPILERAQTLDPKGIFRKEFDEIQAKLAERSYTTVSTFSRDMGAVFSNVTGLSNLSDVNDAHQQLSGVKDGQKTLTSEQKELKKLAKRIIKAIQGPLEDAIRKEAELGGKPYEKELKDLEAILHGNIHRYSTTEDVAEKDAPTISSTTRSREASHPVENGVSGTEIGSDIVLRNSDTAEGMVAARDHSENRDEITDEAAIRLQLIPGEAALPIGSTDIEMHDADSNEHNHNSPNSAPALSNSSTLHSAINPDPLTPPRFEKDLLAPLVHGGVPWYLEPFDPVGTHIHDERWTGREVLRGMSEELSELDDDELDGLVDEDM
ncbi:hypothetical protein M501DRAFT_912817, partial [Patellaria atrata CBS 101060]